VFGLGKLCYHRYMSLLNPTVKTEQETDGRWRASVSLFGGIKVVVAHGATELEAFAKAKVQAHSELEELVISWTGLV